LYSVQSENTLIICDPEPVAMEGLKSLLEATGGARVVATETNLEDAEGALSELQPDLVLVDKKFGTPALAQLLDRAQSTAAIIVWGTAVSEMEALWLFEAGVSGVVSKTASLRDLADCIHAVASGGKWLDVGARPSFVH
jgi:DNA-binding NarL/FixJ family response regulator